VAARLVRNDTNSYGVMKKKKIKLHTVYTTIEALGTTLRRSSYNLHSPHKKTVYIV
jgi:hypothetical protein